MKVARSVLRRAAAGNGRCLSDKMIEHMHIVLPNLVYLSRLQAVLASEGIPDEKIIQSRRQTVDYLNRVCGDFQNVKYDYVRFSMNEMNLKITPSDKDKTQWKSP